MFHYFVVESVFSFRPGDLFFFFFSCIVTLLIKVDISGYGVLTATLLSCLHRIMCETVRYERHEANEVLY